ncbi:MULTISPECIES: HD domain-containing protein [Streptomyces]|uniref:HD domain-containing protein n=2 Tax=Streptomyces TaxID=1883 RepID=UPI00287F6A23|nr:caspase family protein [Streptomyces sp. CGMCC 4.1456]WNF61758.1 caspase family protein [Streptomyces sp. CGMCC 4.1456]
MGEGHERAAGRRRALLIGVKATPDLAEHPDLAARYPRLDFAETDVALLRDALDQSGYEVDTECLRTGYNPVLGRVARFFQSCAPGDTAFLYLSCHGETIQGHDHLILADSQPGPPLPDGSPGLLRGSLLRADASELLSDLPAGVTTIVCLDICRASGPEIDTRPDRLLIPGDREAFLLYSCGPGQRSYADEVEGSWFARALARALSHSTPPTTFHDVVQYTNDLLRELSQPHPDIASPSARDLRPLPARGATEQPNPVICDGSRQSLEWGRSIRGSGLWRHTSGPAEVHERIKDQLEKLVHFVVDSCLGTGAHRADPWSDPLWPIRVEHRLTDLVDRAGLRDEERLSPAETACLLAAAVVHEGAVATALEDLRACLPRAFDPGPRGHDAAQGGHDHYSLVRDAARDVCRAYSLTLRTTETLHKRGFMEAANAADHWLRHRFIADWDPLWERDSVYTTVHDLIGMTVEAIEAAAETPDAGPRTDEARQEIDRRLRQVLGHLTVKPGTSPRINDSRHADTWDDDRDWRPVRGNRWRGRQLARLLWTAGRLAADPRRLSSVVVDHLGAREPLRPAQVVEALGTGLDYDEDDGRSRDTRGLAVRFDCPHPALHAALEELAATVDATVGAFRQEAASQPLLRGLPDRVTTGQLRALSGRYAEPLERFRLAEDEIRPLLMGTQLYGDRMLAVRELYQNALDACRIRDMRRQYGASTPWPGRITFTQGMDGPRPYIQCADDGAGMTRAKLTSMFARAGRRYEQDPEFVLERRNWRRANLPNRPMNSRFGIGVFSYFMLADEVVVWTNPVDQSGRAGVERLRADIQSGSGLLRINTTEDREAPENGGTVVRLYLAEPRENEKRPSLVETLRSLLWVTEHQVDAAELGEDGQILRESHWAPDTLETRPDWHGVPLRAGEDVWLVQGQGQVLLDGVVVRDARKVYGRVINLRERHSPVPSVDRNQILEYDEKLVLRELLGHVPQAVAECQEVSLRWLWELARRAPQVAVEVLASLPQDAVAVLNSGVEQRLGRERVRLRDVGCFPYDADVMGSSWASRRLDIGRPQESSLFESWQFTRLGIRGMHESFAPAGYPEPEGLDAVLFQHDVPWHWFSVVQAAAQSERSVRETLRALRRHAIAGVRVPEALDIRALADVRPAQPAADLYSAYVDMTEEARCLTEDQFGPFRPYWRQTDMLRRDRRPARHAPLLSIAVLHDMPLGEVAALLPQLRLVDPTLPSPPELDAALAQEQPTVDTLQRLAQVGGYASSPWPSMGVEWLPGTLRPVDLLSRAGTPSALRELLELVGRFAPLGFSVEQAPTPEAWQLGTLPPDQWLLLSADRDRTPPWHEGPLGFIHLLVMSNELQQSMGEVARRVNVATAITGVIAPDVPKEAIDWFVPDWVTNDPDHLRAWGRRTLFTPWEITGRYYDGGHDMDEFAAAVRALDACGLIDWRGSDTEALLRQVRASHRLLTPYPDYFSLTGMTNVDVCGDFDEDGVGLAYALAVSAAEGSDLGTLLDELTELDTPLPLPTEQPPPGTRHLEATAVDILALTRDEKRERSATRFRQRLTIPDLMAHADLNHCTLAVSVERLSTYTPLGAPAPAGPGWADSPDFAALADFTPTRFDRAAFDKALLGPGILGPLELVLLAGRFGWTLGETYRRYAPFRCLGLDVITDPPADAEEGLTPDWRDVIVLTEHLTGRAPALTGDVTPEHITLCAEETDLDEASVRERLARYARIFGLRLPALPETPEAPDREVAHP